MEKFELVCILMSKQIVLPILAQFHSSVKSIRFFKNRYDRLFPSYREGDKLVTYATPWDFLSERLTQSEFPAPNIHL